MPQPRISGKISIRERESMYQLTELQTEISLFE
jgi:hypothetical protein